MTENPLHHLIEVASEAQDWLRQSPRSGKYGQGDIAMADKLYEALTTYQTYQHREGRMTEENRYDDTPGHPLYGVAPQALETARKVMTDAILYKDVDPDMAVPLADSVVQALVEAGHIKPEKYPDPVIVASLEIASILREAWNISADDLQAWGRRAGQPMGCDLWAKWAEPRAVKLLDQLRAAGYRICIEMDV